jgi:quercetin dioxygenase-like cupin family protein
MIENQTALEAAAPSSTCSAFKVVRADEGEMLEVFGERVRCVLDCRDTQGHLALHEVETPSGGGPPLHAHSDEDEIFIVQSGCYEFQVGEHRVGAGPGAVIWSPRQVPHTFCNIGDEPGRILILSLPGGCERFFQSCAQEFATGAPRASAIASIGEDHGISFPVLDA